MRKKIIYGCEARGDADKPYLTRYTLVATRWFQLCMHVFHRSDADDLHDHPWDFLTLPLRFGYMEQYATTPGSLHGVSLRHCKVGRIYYRPAEHTHRVILYSDYSFGHRGNLVIKKKKAVTLVLMLKRRREWGFFLKGGIWQLWTEYFTAKGC